MTDTPAPFETFGVRMPVELKQAAVADAERLKLTPAEWGRMAVKRLLSDEVTLSDADPYRSPPTKKEQRAAARAAAQPPAPLERREVQPIPKPGKKR